MALSEPQAPDLHTAAEAVVQPLFKKVKLARPGDGSVPEIVLHHRRRRAQERIVEALASRGTAIVPAGLRKELEALVRRWAADSFSNGFEEADTFEIRCAREHDRVIAEESGDLERLLELLEQEYRQRLIDQLGTIELRGIQTTHRVLEKLDEVYIPLHMEAPPEETDEKDGRLITLSVRPRQEISEVLQEHRHLLVVGSPGSGKSTLVAYLATQTAARRLRLNDQSPLPLPVLVRALQNPSLTVKSLAEQTGCGAALVETALQHGRAVLLLDGLDEAPPDLRQRLLGSLRQFHRSHPGAQIVVTSRPAGAPGEVERQVEDLRPFRLLGLTREEVSRFIERWCLAAEKSVVSDPERAEREAENAAEDLKRRLSASPAVQRIAVNPLLVTILCVVHRFLGRTIPEHRVTLYEKCTDALLYEWDRAKFPEDAAIGLLDARGKRRLLMGIARFVHQEHAAEISEKEVVQLFAETLPDLGRPASDGKALVEEIRDRSGLLVERRPGFFAFSHLTFQEYFCALDFVRTKSFVELVDHFAETWWHEVIVLAAGAPGGGDGVISRRLLAKKRPAAIFLAAQCMETESDMPFALRKRIEDALRKLVPPRSDSVEDSILALGSLAAPVLANALFTGSAGDRPKILGLLSRIDYDPAIPAIAQCVSDIQDAEVYVLMGKGIVSQLTVGSYAAWVLAHKAKISDMALAALKGSAVLLPKQEIGKLLKALPKIAPRPEVVEILRKALRTARPAAPAPKAAAGTE